MPGPKSPHRIALSHACACCPYARNAARSNHTCTASLQCGSSHEWSSGFYERTKQSRSSHTGMAFLQCGSSHARAGRSSLRSPYRSSNMDTAWPLPTPFCRQSACLVGTHACHVGIRCVHYGVAIVVPGTRGTFACMGAMSTSPNRPCLQPEHRRKLFQVCKVCA